MISWECPVCHREITEDTIEEVREYLGYVIHQTCWEDKDD